VISRRGLIGSMIALVASPAIVRCESLMSLRGVPLSLVRDEVWVDDLLVHATEHYAYGWIDRRLIPQLQRWEGMPWASAGGD